MKPDITPKRVWDWIVSGLRRLWLILTRRFGLKIASFILAIMLWNYVITDNPTLTRSKTVTNVSGSVTGQSTLVTYGLALLTDPAELLANFTVQVDVAQAQFSYVSPENVRVSLDLSGVRTAGTQEIHLTANSTYGRVVKVIPETISLTFDTLDSRVVPINVELVGDARDDLWYNVARTNPSSITVSGASALAQSVAQAKVYYDVTGKETGSTSAETYVLLDNDGNEVNPSMLTRSSTSVTVVTDILPMKELPISTEIENAVTGIPKEGYEVKSVTIQPETIMVAGERELLDSISELTIVPVDITDAMQSVKARAKISLLSDFRYTSAEEVYVDVVVAEKPVSNWVNVANVEVVGLDPKLKAECNIKGLRARVEGDRVSVEEHESSGIGLYVDVTGLDEGTHKCALMVDAERYPNMDVQPELPEIEVTLTPVE